MRTLPEEAGRRARWGTAAALLAPHVSTEGDGEARTVRRVGGGVVLEPRGEENEEARQRRDAHVLAHTARPTRRHGHHARLRPRVD